MKNLDFDWKPMALVLLLAMLRIVNSPFGRVLQAIRENEFRAEAIGYRVVLYRTTSSITSKERDVSGPL